MADLPPHLTVFDDVDWCPIHGVDLVEGRCPACQPTRARKPLPGEGTIRVEVVPDAPAPVGRPPFMAEVARACITAAAVCLVILVVALTSVAAALATVVRVVRNARSHR